MAIASTMSFIWRLLLCSVGRRSLVACCIGNGVVPAVAEAHEPAGDPEVLRDLGRPSRQVEFRGTARHPTDFDVEPGDLVRKPGPECLRNRLLRSVPPSEVLGSVGRSVGPGF